LHRTPPPGLSATKPLWVEVRTPVLRTQLSMMRQQLVRRLNELVGSTVIYDIRFC